MRKVVLELVLWIILGLAAGWLASILMKRQGGMLLDIVLGIVGGIVGGLIMSLFGAPGVTGFNFYSLFVATMGAVLLIWVGRALR